VIAYVLALQLIVPAGVALSDPPSRVAAASADLVQDPQAKPKKQKKAKAKGEEKPGPDAPDDVDVAEQDAPEQGTGFKAEWKAHPSLRFGEIARVDLTFRLQEDVHQSYKDAPQLDCPGTALPEPCLFQLHRNRIGVQGTFWGNNFEYQVERELTEQELSDHDLLVGYTPKSQWKDVYVTYRYWKRVQIQAGKFKVPFSLDELTSVTHNDFVYRSLGAMTIAPARDIGVGVHGSMSKGWLTYSAGAFQHDGDNATSKKIAGGDETVAGRMTIAPFRRFELPGDMNIGSAFAYSKLSDDPYLPNGLRARTILSQDTFASSVYVNGYRRRWEADVDWTGGPLGMRSEYFWMTEDRLGQGLAGQDLPAARMQSYYVSGTWIVTGESKKRPVKANEEFLRGGIGAIEVAARYERLWTDSIGADLDIPSRTPRAVTILPSGDHAFTIGVNWTLNRWIKLQFNGIKQRVEDPGQSPVGDAPFWSRVLRFQILI
jgi:phosphate-selective porin